MLGPTATFVARAARVSLLKPLARAEADGDTIYGLIRGTAVNHGGRAKSLTAPIRRLRPTC